MDASAYPGTSERAKYKSVSVSHNHTRSIQPATFPSRRSFSEVAKPQGRGEREFRGGETEAIPACLCSLFSKTQLVRLEGQPQRDTCPLPWDKGELLLMGDGWSGSSIPMYLWEGSLLIHRRKRLDSKRIIKKVWRWNASLPRPLGKKLTYWRGEGRGWRIREGKRKLWSVRQRNSN